MRTAFFKRVRPEQVREIALFIIIIVVIAFFATQVPNFASGRTFTRVATTTSAPAGDSFAYEPTKRPRAWCRLERWSTSATASSSPS